MSHKKPDILKTVQGTFRKDRSKLAAPKLEPSIPEPQKGLLDREARKHYDRLAKILGDMKVLSCSDVVSLELLALSLAEYYEFKKFVKKNGATYRVVTREGSVTYRKRPEIILMGESWQRCATLLARFGLDPVNRSRTTVLPDKETENKWAKYQNKYTGIERRKELHR